MNIHQQNDYLSLIPHYCIHKSQSKAAATVAAASFIIDAATIIKI